MSSNPISKATKAVWNLKKTVPLAGKLMIDPRVARGSKLIFVFVTLGYLLFPYDFIFDSSDSIYSLNLETLLVFSISDIESISVIIISFDSIYPSSAGVIS